MRYYGFSALQDELKSKGLPFSRPYLNDLENRSIILRPMNKLKFHRADQILESKGTLLKKEARIYTWEEIDLICRQVEAHRKVENDRKISV